VVLTALAMVFPVTQKIVRDAKVAIKNPKKREKYHGKITRSYAEKIAIVVTANVKMGATVQDAHTASLLNTQVEIFNVEVHAPVETVLVVTIASALIAHIANSVKAAAQTFDAEELAHVAAIVLVERTVSVLIAHTANLINVGAQTFDAEMLAHVVATALVVIIVNALDVPTAKLTNAQDQIS